MTKMFESIDKTSVEREVEEIYNNAFRKFFGCTDISHPYMCDGYFEYKTKIGSNGRVLIEYKYDEEMSSPLSRAKVIIQTIFYLKRFENDGRILPSVVFIGDKNECFVLHTNDLIKYLATEDVEWSIAPSNAFSKYPDMMMQIASDSVITPFIFDVDENFDFNNVYEKIDSLTNNVIRKVRITEKNIDNIFNFFTKKILSKKSKLGTKDSVSIFIGCLLEPSNFYLHPKKKNVLVTPNSEILVSGGEFAAFFKHFDDSYSLKEKMKFTEIADRLMEDADRRKSGDFWTPTKFVDYAHRRMNEVFGDNWKEDYVVWDCCCGTKNLTRDYKFKELYCSTLFQSELDMGKKYNQEATSFQYDFLNDDFDKLPDGLKTAINGGKKIMFLMNPPYATACNMGSNSASKGKKSCETMITKEMNKIGFGNASNNLFAQFLYRIMLIKEKYNVDVSLAFFCNPIYLSGTTYEKFRNKFLTHFNYEDGFLFNAGHFADCSTNWGINFSCWKSC